jgi:hypothetical protein
MPGEKSATLFARNSGCSFPRGPRRCGVLRSHLGSRWEIGSLNPAESRCTMLAGGKS